MVVSVFYFWISDILEYHNMPPGSLSLRDFQIEALVDSDSPRIGEFWLAERKIILKTQLDFYSSLNKERLLDNDQQYSENLCPNFDKEHLQFASRPFPCMDCPDSNSGHLPMPRTEKMQVSFLFYLENEKYIKHK